ncbi:MAG: hypothetical protein H0T79_02980, partial [Deltaproteobacteria bacterium]|nr:hypothetical protein [Deltaproteobacteria bacterium]
MWLARSGSALIAGVAAMSGCRCSDDRGEIPPPVLVEPAHTVDEIRNTPYYGRTVTITGEVDKVIGDQVFEIEGDGILWEKKLLVLTRSPVRFGPVHLRARDDVVVRGTVQRLSIPELERQLGVKLPHDLARRYRDQPVVIADTVRLIETDYHWSKDYQEGAVVSVIRILSHVDPETLANTAVDLDEVPVVSKAGRGLWIGFRPASQLFVVPMDGRVLATFEPGDRVALRGTIRTMPPEL